ncbi:MAG: GNAT family N-acetyltransferase [Phycisphaerae bacterium]|nr:GNAT family N-acetyltransferase [Phycisphaerae bacterium]
MGLELRDVVRPSDVEAVGELVRATGVFAPYEVDVAVELVQERLARGVASGYWFVFAEGDGRMAGYACYGPIACTVGSFDLYWIAVRPNLQGLGIGRWLLGEVEARAGRDGGRRMYVETSSRGAYDATRRFYEKHGYVQEAFLADFYAPGDGKVIYSRALGGAGDAIRDV